MIGTPKRNKANLVISTARGTQYQTPEKYCMGLGNIFAYPRFRRTGGSLGIDGMINRSRKMIASLKSQRAHSNSKNLELGFERV